jgi:lysophospholipase L1-like esterase
MLACAAPCGAAPGGYVALGDSYSAGSGVLPAARTRSVTPLCQQSERNYPKLARAALGVEDFADETCGGATAATMAAPQTFADIAEGWGLRAPWGRAIRLNGPQFDALRADTALVTLGVGFNDIGFAQIVYTCVAPWPTATACRYGFTRGGVDVLRARIDAFRVALRTVLDGIRARSPQARILTVGYPRILPPDPRRCWPQLPVSPGDAVWLEGVSRDLNRAMRETTIAFGAEYVDLETPSVGHDACQRRASVRWVESLFPTDSQSVMHPSRRGEAAMADEVLKVLRATP